VPLRASHSRGFVRHPSNASNRRCAA
jgi:hypothetical protein